MKVLVAEDDRATGFRIQALLKEWGHDVIAAENGADAWELFKRERPQLIVTDWLMPGIDGVELVKRIRKRSAETGAYAYVVMLTSRAETADLVLGMEAGADDFIAKPFANDELRARIRAGERIIELEQTLDRENRSLIAANAEISATNRQMRRELQAAASIQKSFLPSQIPQTDRARFAWHHEPCQKLSGDTLNILPFDDGRIGLCMVDVCGHGVSAALLSVHLSRLLSQTGAPDSILRQGTENGDSPLKSPAHVAAQLNELFHCDPSGGDIQYFTLLYGILDLERKKFDYTSAGHPGPIVVPANQEKEAMIFEADPPAVGFFKDACFRQQSVSLNSGDRLYLYTDGVFEVRNDKGEEYGELRLADELAEKRNESLDESIFGILGATRQWNRREIPDDDISLLGVEVA